MGLRQATPHPGVLLTSSRHARYQRHVQVHLGGSPAYQLGGTWTQDGQTKAVADKVVVINGNDNIYLLELNADCLPDQVEKALPATMTIDEKTTIDVG